MIEKFMDYLRYELNRAALTIDAYSLDLQQFREWISSGQNKNIDWTSVKANDVRAWLSNLAKQGDSPRTLRRKVISLRALFRWMMKNGYINDSPLRDVPLPKIPKPLPDLVKPSEIEDALNLLNPKDSDEDNKNPLILNSLVIEILYSLGIRRAELVAIDDSDISFSKGEIKVTGKRSKQRVIPVPEKLLAKIKEWQSYRDRNETKPVSGCPLFIVKGKRISPNQVYKIVNQALAGSTARKKSPHALRHTFASGMLNGGAELDSVREFLGHASLATTQIYTHISLNEIKKAYTVAHPRASENKK